jgi:hypothetical protein
VRQHWEPEELVAAWTLVEDDWRLLGNKAGATRLGFALLLKFFEQEGRFPAGPEELPVAAVEYLASQVRVDVGRFGEYRWSGRTIEYHRAQIRNALGFRKATRGDEAKLTRWLAEEVAPAETSDERLTEALLGRCRAERVEPPGRVERIVAGARTAAAEAFCARTLDRLGDDVSGRLEALLDDDSPRPTGRGGVLAELKSDPARVSLESLLGEIDKLERIRGLGLPEDLFAGAPEVMVAAWRARAAVEYPSDLRDRPRVVRVTLLAALCWCRMSELTDSLVDLLLGIVLKVNTRAERRVEGELIRDLKRVRGKEGILFRLAQAAVDHPDKTVRGALYPVVGEATLRELAQEAKASESAFRARVRTVLRSSYSSHYRRLLPPLLAALDVRSNNTTHRPVVDALAMLRRYTTRSGAVRFYHAEDVVPLDGVVPAEWRDASSTRPAGLNASPTSCACWGRCGMGSVAGTCGSSAASGGGTPMRTCRSTSSSIARSTPRRCASRWMPPRSSTSWRTGCAGRTPAWMRPSEPAPVAGCTSPPAEANGGSPSPNWTSSPNLRPWVT